MNVQYSIVSKCEPNSKIGRAINFYDEFVEKLTDKSKVFHHLVNLVYAFDMTNLKMIKAHLEEFRPKVIIFFTFKNNNIANRQKSFPCLAVNRYLFFKESLAEEINFEKKLEVNEDVIDDFAINLFILFYHELMRHQKLEYTLGENCINKNHLKLITELMLEVEGKGNLINRADLFIGENYEVLKRYIILKFLATKKRINISEKKTIKEEIQELEKYINNEEVIIESNNQKKEKEKYKLIENKKKGQLMEKVMIINLN